MIDCAKDEMRVRAACVRDGTCVRKGSTRREKCGKFC